MRTLAFVLLTLLLTPGLRSQELHTPLLNTGPNGTGESRTSATIHSPAEPRVSWVQHYGSQNVPSKEEAHSAALGRQGDLAVLGMLEQSCPLTVMYAPTGKIRWADVYRSADGNPDAPRCIGVDTLGNVFVIIQHLVSDTYRNPDYSCVVIKYSNEGKRTRVTEYPGSPRAAAVDQGGNVYLGLSWNASGKPNRYGTQDYVIVKLSPDGTVLWRTVYDGPWGGEDRIGALCVDREGSVYVTGCAYHAWGSRIATMKLDPGGSVLWLALRPVLEGAGFSFSHGSFYYPEHSLLLTVDSGGAASVAFAGSALLYPKSDDRLLHYDASGHEQWDRTSLGMLRAMASDPSGNIYLATQTAIVRVSSSGAVQWTHTGEVASFLMCETGLLFAGSTVNGRCCTRAFDTTGVLRWSVLSPGAPGIRDSLMAIATDGAGNLTAVGTRFTPDGSSDMAGSSYSTQGAHIGVFLYDGPARSDNRAAVSGVDRIGNIIVAGSENGIIIVKYGPSGNTLFVARDSSAGAKNVSLEAMTVDAQGGFRIAGLGDDGSMKLFCYSSDGGLQWATSRTGVAGSSWHDMTAIARGSALPPSLHRSATTPTGTLSHSGQAVPDATAGRLSSPFHMATDEQGNTLVLCNAFSGPTRDAFIVAFGPDGTEKWVQRYPDISVNTQGSLRLDPAGNAYVGTSAQTGDRTTSVLLKFSRNGQLLWERKASDVLDPLQGRGNQKFLGLSVDALGRAVSAGLHQRVPDSLDSLFILCYGPSGEVIWHAGNHRGVSPYGLLSVLHCPDGDVWITGGGFLRDYGSFLLASRYDSHGNQKSSVDISVESFYSGAAAVDTRGFLYVTGRVGLYSQEWSYDIITRCFGPPGSQSWVEQFNAAPRATEFPVNVAATPDGGIIVTGYSEIPVQDGPPRETGRFYTAVKYEPLIAPGSLIANPGFEKEMVSWTLHSDGNARGGSVPGGEKSPLAARVIVDRPDSIITLYQSGIPLEPRAHYRLTFSGRCNTGHDVEASLIKDTEPYASYGLSGTRCDLGKEWSSISVDFVTEWFTTLVSDGRIMFRFAGLAEAGDEYFFDNIVLERLGPPDVRTVVRHPADAVAGVGQRVMFRVLAPQATSFQWQKNGNEIRGATWDRYATLPLAAADSGAEFSCVVTGPAGILQTRGAFLAVRGMPVSRVPNHRFEMGTRGWSFPSGAAATFTVEGPPDIGHAAIHQEGTDLQLMATGIELIEGTRYLLKFRSRSSSGHNLAAGLLKHTAPYTGYGLELQECDLTPEWKEFSVDFVAGGFPGTVADARLMFWMSPYAVAGDDYFFDDVRLEEFIEGTTTDVQQEQVSGPLTFRLDQNFPNPFNPETTIRFSIVEREQVRLAVYDILGKEVAILAGGMLEPGEHVVRFRPEGLSSGVYIYRLEGARQVLTGKMLMLR